ncbi:MAG: hypothetical protein R2834_05610 [Rhodothermales bacterium]
MKKIVLLSAQRALLSMITSNMRAIAVAMKDGVVYLRFYFADSPSEDELDILESVSGEMMADFDDVSVETDYVVSNDRVPQLLSEGSWVYMRKE